MTNLATALAVVVTMVVGTAGTMTSALAGADSPYPAHFKNPNLPFPSVGVGSGIPSQYRLGN
jgi:hypothetical protein